MTQHVLPDLLQKNLKVVFCGTAPGHKSAEAGAYYADPTNAFWKILFNIGLTSRLLSPNEFRLLPEFGIGLTDLAKFVSGNDVNLKKKHFHVDAFEAKIMECQPRVLAFNGKRGTSEYLRTKQVKFGPQSNVLGATKIFVLPSTSGSANGSRDERYWRELAEFVR